MTIDDLMSSLFPQEYQSWMQLLEITDQLRFLDHNFAPSEMIDQFNHCLQKNWLRPKDKERWELVTQWPSEQTHAIKKALDHIGIFNEITPRLTHYDCIFFMGTTSNDVIDRMKYLNLLKNKGLQFDRLYVMSAFRELDPKLESKVMAELSALNLAVNELEMMEHLVPRYIQHDEVIYVNAISHERKKRATTKDTYITWQDEFLGKNNDHQILIISSQPFVHYQNATAFQVLSHDYQKPVSMPLGMANHGVIIDQCEIETVGHRDGEQLLPEIWLDSLARFVYSSSERWKHQIV